MLPRSKYLCASFFAASLLLCGSPALADEKPKETEPKVSSAKQEPEKEKEGSSDDEHSHSEESEPGLTPEQEAKLAAFQSALVNRDAAAATVDTAMEAANLAAAAAFDAEQEARTASQASAAAAVRAASAEFEASQMRMTVDGFVREMALNSSSQSSVVISLVVSGAPPAEVLQAAEASEKTADAVTVALRQLVDLTEKSKVAQQEALAAQVKAQVALQTAQSKSQEAAEILKVARSKFFASQKLVTTLLETDPVVSAALNATGTPGCAPAEKAALFPNGLLPAEALCELTTSPPHKLRSDAAAAFDAMSSAYLEETGEPLCITDSYRSLAAQISLKAAKPYLAAVPGTSNHGWGIAIDMCGGIENFGTDAHNWMRANAGLFGWLHPSWAQENGSKPEPWHWEFSPELAKQMKNVLASTQPADGKKQDKTKKNSSSKQ